MNAPIGSLRVDLGFDGAEFTRGVVDAQGAFSRFAREIGDMLAGLERTVRRVGIGLTAGITAPFAALVHVSRRGAQDFQSAMNDVHAALRGLPAEQLEQLSQLAQRLGPEVGRSAVEAANGFEMLALAGLSADQILRGAGEATLRLAAANDAELEPAAAAVTDVMAQFGLVTADLPQVVDQITGALDASKLSFDDFRLAIGQAGGVAGPLGVQFEEFVTAIAATSEAFASGSDAGTSFKAFLQRLQPQSQEAERVMHQLNLQFFDAQGRMKSLADVSEELRAKMGNLSEQSLTEAMTTLFGTDAMRTAIALMNTGRERFEELRATIEGTDAGEKLAIQLAGAEAATDRMSAAFDRLKIALGEAGILAAFTALVAGARMVFDALASLPQPVLTAGLVIGGLAAAIGPLIVALVTVGRFALPLLLGRLAQANLATRVLGTALVILINPIGALAIGLLRAAVALTGASSALSLFAGTLARVLGPLGLVISALGLLYYTLGGQRQASEHTRQATEALSAAMAAYEEAALAAAAATGEARREALAAAAAKREEALQVMNNTRALLAEARARLASARTSALEATAMVMRTNAADRERTRYATAGAQASREQAAIDLEALQDQWIAAERQFQNAERTIAAAQAASAGGTRNVDFSRPERERRRRDRSEDLARRREEIRLQQALEVARARGDVEEERRIERLIALAQRQREYEDAGLKGDLARAAAQRDMAELQAARELGLDRERNLARSQADLDAARIAEDLEFVRQTEDRLLLTERIAFWRRQELSVQEAQTEAEAELARIEEAREARRRREAEQRERERQATLARLRSDSQAQIRAREREAELGRRAREIYEAAEGGLSRDQAMDRARLELDEEEQARLRGTFRDTFREGVRAALDGDFRNWFERWWTDRLTRSLEDALNNVADLLFQLVHGKGGPGGGLLGLLGGFSSILGGGTGAGAAKGFAGVGDSPWWTGPTGGLVPGFATGGSFRVGGLSGPDRNLIQFRASRGEIVDIHRGEDSGRRVVEIRLKDDLLDARIERGSGVVIARAYPAMREDTARYVRDGQRRSG